MLRKNEHMAHGKESGAERSPHAPRADIARFARKNSAPSGRNLRPAGAKMPPFGGKRPAQQAARGFSVLLLQRLIHQHHINQIILPASIDGQCHGIAG